MVSMVIDFLRGGDGTAIDPCCGMEVDTSDPPGGSYEYQGTTYYFCARGCNLNFQDEPEAFLSGEKTEEM